MEALGMGSGSSMVWGLVFGAIGTGYIMYGKKLQKGLPLMCGLGLVVLPYFLTGTLPLVLVCGALCVAPFCFR